MKYLIVLFLLLMIIAGSIGISSQGGIFGDNHLKERDRTFVNLQRNNKNIEEVSFVFSFCLYFSLILCFSFFSTDTVI